MCTLIYLIIFNWTFLFSSPLETLTRVSQFSHSVVSDSFLSHGLQHARLPCLSPTPGACSNTCPSSRWCDPTISSFVIAFSACLQPFPASGSFPVSQFFASDGQSSGVSASEIPLELNGLISLQSKGLSRIFSNTIIWKYEFFDAQPSWTLWWIPNQNLQYNF